MIVIQTVCLPRHHALSIHAEPANGISVQI